nr:reverse transcriptase domain-containing protein [Tanacetum cinerariifolium]
MSDSEDLPVTYMKVSSLSDDLSNIGSPRVDGLLIMPEDAYAYAETAMHEPHSPEFVPKPVYPEFMPLEDDEDDENPEEDPVDYATDRDDDDEEEEDPSRDDADDEEEEEDEDEEEEEEEHPALADSIPPPLVHRTTARISIPAQAPSYLSIGILSCDDLVESRVTIYFPSTTTTTTYCTSTYQSIYGYGESCCTIHLHLSTSMRDTTIRADAPKVMFPSRKSLCIALDPRFEVEECSSAPTARPTRGFRADYGFVGTLDVEIRELGQRITDFITTVRQDTDEIYRRLDDAEDDRLLMSGQLNSLRRNWRSHARTTRLIKSEARASREAWSQHRPSRGPTHLDVLEEAVVVLRSSYVLAMLYSLLSIMGNSQLELALMCARMFLEESDKIERYVGGLPDMIHGSVMASKPKTMQDAVEFATELMDKKIHTFTKRQTENKRKFDDTSRNNQN